MNTYLRLRQICLVAHRLEPLEDDLSNIFGIRICRRGDLSAYGLENIVFPVDTNFIEVVAPVAPNTAAERFLVRSHGRGGYMALFDCDDPIARQEHAEALGVKTVHVNQQEQYLGVQLHPRECRGTMIEFCHTAGGDDLQGPYWPAGERWQEAITTDTAKMITGIELESPDPDDLAQHWSRLLNMPLHTEANGQSIRVGDQCIRFVASSDAGERLSAVEILVDDVTKVQKTAVERGLAVEEGAIQLGGIAFKVKS